MAKKKVLFLCTGNACRSQMAEGWARSLCPASLEPYSAGVMKAGVDPRAARAMAEAGVDISGQYSKTMDELPERELDAVVTLCDQANESCPFFPGRVVRLHHGFDDPPSLALGALNEESALEPYRRVRDEIRELVLGLPERLCEADRD
jgi:arsenate reductase